MERECLRIGKPEVVTAGEESVLRVKIEDGGIQKTLEYRVGKEYEPYLTWERSDSFVVLCDDQAEGHCVGNAVQ